jgi:chaperone modulatory protein CbpM
MTEKTLSGTLLDESAELSLDELCRACSRHKQWVIELVEEGVLEPIGQNHEQWRFSATSLQRARITMRLERDLGVNLPGIALTLDLLDEIEALRTRLSRLDTDRNGSRDS